MSVNTSINKEPTTALPEAVRVSIFGTAEAEAMSGDEMLQRVNKIITAEGLKPLLNAYDSDTRYGYILTPSITTDQVNDNEKPYVHQPWQKGRGAGMWLTGKRSFDELIHFEAKKGTPKGCPLVLVEERKSRRVVSIDGVDHPYLLLPYVNTPEQELLCQKNRSLLLTYMLTWARIAGIKDWTSQTTGPSPSLYSKYVEMSIAMSGEDVDEASDALIEQHSPDDCMAYMKNDDFFERLMEYYDVFMHLPESVKGRFAKSHKHEFMTTLSYERMVYARMFEIKGSSCSCCEEAVKQTHDAQQAQSIKLLDEEDANWRSIVEADYRVKAVLANTLPDTPSLPDKRPNTPPPSLMREKRLRDVLDHLKQNKSVLIPVEGDICFHDTNRYDDDDEKNHIQEDIGKNNFFTVIALSMGEEETIHLGNVICDEEGELCTSEGKAKQPLNKKATELLCNGSLHWDMRCYGPILLQPVSGHKNKKRKLSQDE